MRAEGIMVKVGSSRRSLRMAETDFVFARQLLDEVEMEEDLVAEPVAEPDSPTKAKRNDRKTLPASYEPDKRADSWLKVKKDYLDDLGDSLDLVPLGAWHGSGRKSKWWSPILLGAFFAFYLGTRLTSSRRLLRRGDWRLECGLQDHVGLLGCVLHGPLRQVRSRQRVDVKDLLPGRRSRRCVFPPRCVGLS